VKTKKEAPPWPRVRCPHPGSGPPGGLLGLRTCPAVLRIAGLRPPPRCARRNVASPEGGGATVRTSGHVQHVGLACARSPARSTARRAASRAAVTCVRDQLEQDRPLNSWVATHEPPRLSAAGSALRGPSPVRTSREGLDGAVHALRSSLWAQGASLRAPGGPVPSIRTASLANPEAASSRAVSRPGPWQRCRPATGRGDAPAPRSLVTSARHPLPRVRRDPFEGLHDPHRRPRGLHVVGQVNLGGMVSVSRWAGPHAWRSS